MDSFTLISAHFGDTFWINHTIAQVGSTSSIEKIRLVDQDRSAATARWLVSLPAHPEVVSFPEDGEQIEQFGHDHAASLNKCMKLAYDTDYTVLLDSDCFPVTEDWVERIQYFLADHDAIVARDPVKYGLSHPCFMVLPVSALARLDFGEGLIEAGIDTGRLIGLQLCKMGHTVRWDTPAPAFNGKRGHFYLDGALYHHGSASFVSSSDPKLGEQVNKRVERFFRAKIERGQFKLSWFELGYLWLLRQLG